MIVTKEYLRSHKLGKEACVFVFGDNTIRKGYGGAAKLRDESNAYGFITKKFPNNDDSSFFRPDEYKEVFQEELNKLINLIESHPQYTYLISKLGGGLANKYRIFEEVIEPGIQVLKKFNNVKFLW